MIYDYDQELEYTHTHLRRERERERETERGGESNTACFYAIWLRRLKINMHVFTISVQSMKYVQKCKGFLMSTFLNV